MARDFRLDALVTAAREMPAARSPRHRGGVPLAMDDAQLIRVIDSLVASGEVQRDGRRLWLRERPTLDPQMRERVDRLLAGLRETGAAPPRIDGPAARLGIPPDVLQQLRRSGELVTPAPGIDFAHDTWDALQERIDGLAAGGPLTVARVRDSLRTSRRHAEAILSLRRARREMVRSRRRGG